MLDIKFIRENAKLVEVKSAQKGYYPNIKKLLSVDESRRKIIEVVDSLRAERKIAAEIRDENEGSTIKLKLKQKEDELEKLNEQFYQLIREVPNLPKEDVPVGRDENDDKVLKENGEKTKFDFEPRDHLELGLANDLIDVGRATKTSGPRFNFLKNELAILEFALIKLAFDTLTPEGFIPIIPPVIINSKATVGLGYPEYETGEGYQTNGQYLVGTAEHSIVPMHMDETFREIDLPIRYVGFSTAFRREAGSYGKDTRGILRVHQFDKVEMVSFVLPKNEDSEHQFLLSLEEKLMNSLELPYRVVNKCTGELGFPTSRKYDIETWLPTQEKYRETHSASSNGDFQARRLNIKYQKAISKLKANLEVLSDGSRIERTETPMPPKKDFVYILNATAFAIGRTIIAIMENYQQKDGSIQVPKVLQKYTGFTKIPS